MFRWAFLTQVTPLLGLQQPSSGWASSLLQLYHQHPQSTPGLPQPRLLSLCNLARLQPQAEGLLACHWNSKTIHSPLWRLLFSFLLKKYQKHTLALVACLVSPCHKNGPLTFREYDILNVGLLQKKKKTEKEGKQVTFVTNLLFLSPILVLPKRSPHLLYIAF